MNRRFLARHHSVLILLLVAIAALAVQGVVYSRVPSSVGISHGTAANQQRGYEEGLYELLRVSYGLSAWE